MKFYIEVTLLPALDVPLYFLWEKIYSQVHLSLVEMQDAEGQVSIGVAFPGYDASKFQLGSKLRLFADDKAHFGRLDLGKWLHRFSDYVHLTSIRDVPAKCDYALFRRLQPKSSNARLARRKAKRQGITVAQAMQLLNGRKEQMGNVPFIWCKSLSSDKRYRLMIESVQAEQIQSGRFSTYGLSSSSTVPVF
ncbi:MAG: type I-F CRISPR-associated endoribonuclease Cas6/Csy4 [Desulfobulbaceae bacterium]|nr:MAG: type I-F CRISPR-associated endoribonuclease Cas6/Csy4 [Desulfobulbaceae bacterium]